jgi:hypothetical protein
MTTESKQAPAARGTLLLLRSGAVALVVVLGLALVAALGAGSEAAGGVLVGGLVALAVFLTGSFVVNTVAGIAPHLSLLFALMTTAYNVDNAGGVIGDMSTGKASTPFARGAGHVDPNRAVDPGLVYDAGTEDYVTFLCALGYTAEQLAVFGSSANCSTRTGASVGDLNYPAFSAVLGSDRRAVTQRRTVRNVGGNVRATYTAKITSPAGVLVTVKPRKLAFSATQEKQDYAITFAQLPSANVTVKHTFGSIVWSDGKHTVTSPIAITWPASQVADM